MNGAGVHRERVLLSCLRTAMHPPFVSTAAALFAFAASAVHAQVVVNGQIYTNGLAIVDAPQPGTYVAPPSTSLTLT